MRLFKLAAALSVLVALIAVIAVARGGPAWKSHLLILAAVALGGCALIGTAAMTLPYIYKQKDKHDPRS